MPNRTVQIERSYISVGPNDVILGRGNHLSNAGNEKFLDLVRSRSMEYWSCSDNADKDNIARQVIDTVQSLGGRFLRSVADKPRNVNSSKKETTNTTKSTGHWEIASHHTILIKVKQTFRDLTASAKKRTASSKASNNPTGKSCLSTDIETGSGVHQSTGNLSQQHLSDNANEKTALHVASSQKDKSTKKLTSQSSMKVPAASCNSKPPPNVHSVAEIKDSVQGQGDDPFFNSKAAVPINRSDTGAFPLLAAQSTRHSSGPSTSQTSITERDNNGVTTSASYQPLNESLIRGAIASQSDLIHRNLVDQQMLAILHEQQSRLPKLLQLASDTYSSTNVVDHIYRNPNNDTMQSLIRTELQRQQQSRSALLPDQLNLEAFHQQPIHTRLGQPNYGTLLSTLHSIQPQQNTGILDRWLSQLSPSEIANIHATLFANQIATSPLNTNMMMSGLGVPINTHIPLPNFGINNSSNLVSAFMYRDLQQQYIRNNHAVFDPLPKSDSDASSDDKKPAARR